MKRASLLVLVVLAAGLFASAGCNYNKQRESGSGPGNVDSASLDKVDFTLVQATLIAPKCLGCHATVTGNQGGTNLESLKSIRALLPRISFRALEKRDMPPGGLSEREALVLRTWIEQGAPESLVGPQESSGDPTIEQGPNDWAKIRDRIFAVKCLDCHSGKDPQGGLDLTTLATTRLKAAAIFDRVIVQGNMPIAPYPMLAPRERRVLLKWFDLGMPE